MKESCLLRIPRQRLTMLRQEYLTICDGDKGAALLLAFFEHGHNFKLKMQEKNIQANNVAEKHGDPRTQDEQLYQFYTMPQLQEGLLSIVGRPAIQKGIKILEEKKFISIHRNPIKRYHFDSTKHFLLHTKTVNSILQKLSGVLTETARPSNTNSEASSHKLTEQVLILPTKITSKITSDLSSKISREKNPKNSFSTNQDKSPSPPLRGTPPPKVSGSENQPSKSDISESLNPSTNSNIPDQSETPLKHQINPLKTDNSQISQTTISNPTNNNREIKLAEAFSTIRYENLSIPPPNDKEFQKWIKTMGGLPSVLSTDRIVEIMEFTMTKSEKKKWEVYITKPGAFVKHIDLLIARSQGEGFFPD